MRDVDRSNGFRRLASNGLGVYLRTALSAGLALIILFGFSGPATVSSAASSQQSAAQRLYQQALHKEEAVGDAAAAIRLYEQLLAGGGVGNELAAGAELRLAKLYTTLGRFSEARTVYERVLQEYAGQTEPLRVASERLERLKERARASAVSGIELDATYTLVFGNQQGLGIGYLDFSPDGERFVFTAYKPEGPEIQSMYVSNRTGTVIRPLLEETGGAKWFAEPRWSPDGRCIAYIAQWPPDGSQAEGSSAIFIIDPDEGEPRQVGGIFDGYVNALRWLPDGKHLSYLGSGNLATVDLDGQVIRTASLAAFPGLPAGRPFSLGSYSPDGRWLTLTWIDNEVGFKQMLVPVSGGEAQEFQREELGSKTRAHLRNSSTWALDGQSVYFVSARGGGFNIWKIAFDPEAGRFRGDPEQVTFLSGVGVMAPKVLSGNGLLIFTILGYESAIRVAETAHPDDARVVASGQGPQVSPDGQTIYFAEDEPGKEGIFAVAQQGGTPREVMRSTQASAQRWRLSPSGELISYFTRAGDEIVLCAMPVDGGQPHELSRHVTKHSEHVPAWSPDGSQVAYAVEKDLYAASVEGREPLKLTGGRVFWEEWSIRWSPDGEYIAAFGYDEGEDENAVFVIPATGGDPRRLTPPEEDQYKEGLAWHPNGQSLSYMYYGTWGEADTSTDGTRQRSLDGSTLTLVVDQPFLWDYVGVWAPDGRKFFFSSTVPANGAGVGWGLYTHDVESGETTAISPIEAGDSSLPTWSRDGETMAWELTNMTIQVWSLKEGGRP